MVLVHKHTPSVDYHKSNHMIIGVAAKYFMIRIFQLMYFDLLNGQHSMLSSYNLDFGWMDSKHFPQDYG